MRSSRRSRRARCQGARRPSSTVSPPGCGRGVAGMWRARRMWRTACPTNGRPLPVRSPAAFSSTAISVLVRSWARRLISSTVSGGVRVASLTLAGRWIVCCSAAPVRQRIPTETSRLAGWEVIVTSAIRARSSRLRSFSDVLSAAQSAGTSRASASSCSREGSGAGAVCSASSASASASSRSLCSQRVSTLRATRRFSGSQA